MFVFLSLFCCRSGHQINLKQGSDKNFFYQQPPLAKFIKCDEAEGKKVSI